MEISESNANSARGGNSKRKAPSDKVGIIVAGMHRSGTSATMRMLNLLGCDIASGLVEPDQHNPTGYWEAVSIAKLNDEMLNSAGFEWNDLQPLRPSWFESPKFAEFQERAVQLLESQVKSSHLFAIKDPRFCRVLPVWTSAVEALGARPVIISPIRSPSHVSTSLLKRNGMNRSVAQLLWLRHVLDAELSSRNYKRAFVSYSGLLSDWRGVANHLSRELGVIWPRDSVQTASQIDAFINSGKIEPVDRFSELPPLVLMVYQIFAASRQGGLPPADLEQLDQARASFDLACSTFGRPLIENQEHGRWLAERLNQKEAQIAELDVTREKLAEQVTKLAANGAIQIETFSAASAKELERRIAEIEDEAVASGISLPIKSAHVEASEDALSRFQSIWRETVSRATEQADALAGLEIEIANRTPELNQAQTLLAESVEVLTKERDGLSAEKGAAAAKLLEVEARLIDLTSRNDAAELQNQSLKESLQKSQARSSTLEKALSEASAEKIKLAAEIERREVAESDAKRFREEALQAEIRLEAAVSKLTELQRDIATRNSTLADYDREAASNREEVRALGISLSQARSELQEINQELVEARLRYSIIADNLNDAIDMIASKDGKIVHFESECRDLLADLDSKSLEIQKQHDANVALKKTLAGAQAEIISSDRRGFQESVLRQEAARALKLRNAEFDEVTRDLEIARDAIKASIEDKRIFQERERDHARLQGEIAAVRSILADPMLSGVLQSCNSDDLIAQMQTIVERLNSNSGRLAQIERSGSWRFIKAMRNWSKRNPAIKRLFTREKKHIGVT